MNIITNKPVIFSNAEGEKTPMNPDALKAGADVLTGIGTTLAARQRQFTEVEQRCGKKPLGKKQRAQWQKCVDANGGLAMQPTTPPAQEQPLADPNTKQPMSKGMKIGLIVGGVVVAGIIAFVIYKSSKE
jgi:hypothetical protein